MKVLLLKLSSMGDIIHTLPAVHEASQYCPDLQIDWVVEQGFAEIAAWHPSVNKVIISKLRSRDYKAVLGTVRELRLEDYDLVIDAQGLIKSAIFARFARTKTRVGYAADSARESIASLFYNNKLDKVADKHAIEKIRLLFARAFGYSALDTEPVYGVDWQQVEDKTHIIKFKDYVMFLHGTTWDTKHWPEQYWRQLAGMLDSHGLNVAVTYANPEQEARAKRLAELANVILLPHLTINQAVAVLARARAVAAVDTGFAHLSAALNRPVIAVYGPSDVNKAGTVGARTRNLHASMACSPCNAKTCSYKGYSRYKPACMDATAPQQIIKQLENLGCL